MNCEEFKDALVVRVYGDLPDEEEAALQRHAAACPGCARALARTLDVQGALDLRGDVPEPDWEASWRAIGERTRKRSGRRLAFGWPARRWATAAAAVAAVFVLGVLVGRSMFFGGKGPRQQETDHTYPGQVTVAAYTETLEPLLIDFLNNRGGVRDDEVSALTHRVVTDMLAQTRMLKRAAVRSGDEQLYQLLEDVEVVLISIANLGGSDGDVVRQLDRVIRDKSIVPRLERLASGNDAI
jgi:hypothetical protein